MDKKRFALIGKSLKHSFSKDIHGYFADYQYDIIEVSSENLKSVFDMGLAGFNVTIPYKTEIIKYLDFIDDRAKEIGAVNTVINKDGKWYGYNTDFDGMKYMLYSANITLENKSVMILGSGGTSKTATAVAKNLGAKSITVVSRGGIVNYENCYKKADTEVIINTTPVGMYPNYTDCAINVNAFSKLKGVVDVIYNPLKTKLLFEAELNNIKTCSGIAMLVAQAKFASELFTNNRISDVKIKQVISKIIKQKQNVVLVGMPGSGKSTIGKELALKLNKEFIDTDKEIEKKFNMPIPEIFVKFGEKEFRKEESEVLITLGADSGKIIATGGGIVKNQNNLYPLRANGKIVYIKRALKKLATKDRPLSKDLKTVKKLYNERKKNYIDFSEITVKNNKSVSDTVKEVIKKL